MNIARFYQITVDRFNNAAINIFNNDTEQLTKASYINYALLSKYIDPSCLFDIDKYQQIGFVSDDIETQISLTLSHLRVLQLVAQDATIADEDLIFVCQDSHLLSSNWLRKAQQLVSMFTSNPQLDVLCLTNKYITNFDRVNTQQEFAKLKIHSRPELIVYGQDYLDQDTSVAFIDTFTNSNSNCYLIRKQAFKDKVLEFIDVQQAYSYYLEHQRLGTSNPSLLKLTGKVPYFNCDSFYQYTNFGYATYAYTSPALAIDLFENKDIELAPLLTQNSQLYNYKGKNFIGKLECLKITGAISIQQYQDFKQQLQGANNQQVQEHINSLYQQEVDKRYSQPKVLTEAQVNDSYLTNKLVNDFNSFAQVESYQANEFLGSNYVQNMRKFVLVNSPSHANDSFNALGQFFAQQGTKDFELVYLPDRNNQEFASFYKASQAKDLESHNKPWQSMRLRAGLKQIANTVAADTSIDDHDWVLIAQDDIIFTNNWQAKLNQWLALAVNKFNSQIALLSTQNTKSLAKVPLPSMPAEFKINWQNQTEVERTTSKFAIPVYLNKSPLANDRKANTNQEQYNEFVNLRIHCQINGLQNFANSYHTSIQSLNQDFLVQIKSQICQAAKYWTSTSCNQDFTALEQFIELNNPAQKGLLAFIKMFLGLDAFTYFVTYKWASKKEQSTTNKSLNDLNQELIAELDYEQLTDLEINEANDQLVNNLNNQELTNVYYIAFIKLIEGLNFIFNGKSQPHYQLADLSLQALKQQAYQDYLAINKLKNNYYIYLTPNFQQIFEKYKLLLTSLVQGDNPPESWYKLMQGFTGKDYFIEQDNISNECQQYYENLQQELFAFNQQDKLADFDLAFAQAKQEGKFEQFVEQLNKFEPFVRLNSQQVVDIIKDKGQELNNLDQGYYWLSIDKAHELWTLFRFNVIQGLKPSLALDFASQQMELVVSNKNSTYEFAQDFTNAWASNNVISNGLASLSAIKDFDTYNSNRCFTLLGQANYRALGFSYDSLDVVSCRIYNYQQYGLIALKALYLRQNLDFINNSLLTIEELFARNFEYYGQITASNPMFAISANTESNDDYYHNQGAGVNQLINPRVSQASLSKQNPVGELTYYNKLPKYLINLKTQPERLEFMSKQINLADFKIVEAVDGRTFTSEQLAQVFDIDAFYRDLKRPPISGECGCTLSHCQVYSDILSDDSIAENQWVLIIEDDSRFVNDWAVKLNKTLAYIEENNLDHLELILGAHIFLYEFDKYDTAELKTITHIYTQEAFSMYISEDVNLNYLSGYFPHGSSCYLIRKRALRKNAHTFNKPYWVADQFKYVVDFSSHAYALMNPPISKQNLELESSIATERVKSISDSRKPLQNIPLPFENIDCFGSLKFVIQRSLTIEQIKAKFPGFTIVPEVNWKQMSTQQFESIYDKKAFERNYGRSPTDDEINRALSHYFAYRAVAADTMSISFVLIVEDDALVDSSIVAKASTIAKYIDTRLTLNTSLVLLSDDRIKYQAWEKKGYDWINDKLNANLTPDDYLNVNDDLALYFVNRKYLSGACAYICLNYNINESDLLDTKVSWLYDDFTKFYEFNKNSMVYCNPPLAIDYENTDSSFTTDPEVEAQDTQQLLQKCQELDEHVMQSKELNQTSLENWALDFDSKEVTSVEIKHLD